MRFNLMRASSVVKRQLMVAARLFRSSSQAATSFLIKSISGILRLRHWRLSALNRQCLSRRIPDIDLMRKEVAAWELDRNNRAATINWRFTTEDARIKLKRIYPQL